MIWSREDAPWRQGSILAQRHFQAVGWADAGDADLAVAISHDCDITNDDFDDEPAVEFILAQGLEQKDGNYTYGKNPRVLHLDYLHTGNGNIVPLKLDASKKRTVSKSLLEEREIQPDQDYELTDTQVKILQSWLAARYKRPALPNSLVERLRPVFSYIQKEGKKNSSGILSFRLSYEPQGELHPEDLYRLKFNIVYAIDDEHGPMAKSLAENLEEKFKEPLGKAKKPGPVDLRLCKAFSEAEFTVQDMRDTVEYRAEHISYRTDPPGPVIEDV